MKKNIALLSLAAALMAMPAFTHAQDATASATPDTTAPAAKKKHGGAAIHGKVSAVDATAMTVTVSTKKGGDQTFTVNTDTKISKNDASATFADITVGEVVSVASKKDGEKMTATKITIGKPKKKAE
jgi:hypothetical protein